MPFLTALTFRILGSVPVMHYLSPLKRARILANVLWMRIAVYSSVYALDCVTPAIVNDL